MLKYVISLLRLSYVKEGELNGILQRRNLSNNSTCKFYDVLTISLNVYRCQSNTFRLHFSFRLRGYYKQTYTYSETQNTKYSKLNIIFQIDVVDNRKWTPKNGRKSCTKRHTKNSPRYSSLSFKAKGKVTANYRLPNVLGNAVRAWTIEEELLDYLKRPEVFKTAVESNFEEWKLRSLDWCRKF